MAKTNSNIVTSFNMGPYGAPIVLNVTRFCHKGWGWVGGGGMIMSSEFIPERLGELR